MVVGKQDKANAGADEMYKRILLLDEQGQKIALDATRQSHPEYIKAMEEKGYLSPEGEIVKMKEEKKVEDVRTWTDEQGWLRQTTTFDDGTSKTIILGREAQEKEEETGPTISESIALEKLRMEKEKIAKGQGDKIVEKALDMTGTRYGEGEIDKNSNKVTKKQVADWNKRYTENYNMLLDLFGGTPSIPTGNLSLDMIPNTSPEVAQRKEEIALHKAQYEDRPDSIMTIESKLGIPITGKWSPQLEFMLYTRGMGGK